MYCDRLHSPQTDGQHYEAGNSSFASLSLLGLDTEAKAPLGELARRDPRSGRLELTAVHDSD